jgi:hypothetical protein
MFIKIERNVQFLQTGTCVFVANAYHCGYPGEKYVLFDNFTWKGAKRRPTKKRPTSRRLYAVRSLFVAKLPKEQIHSSWTNELFLKPTLKIPWERPAKKKPPVKLSQGQRVRVTRKPARTPRNFKQR